VKPGKLLPLRTVCELIYNGFLQSFRNGVCLIPFFDRNVLRIEPSEQQPENLPDEDEIRQAIEKKLSEKLQTFRQLSDGAVRSVAAGLYHSKISYEELKERADGVCDGLLRLEKEHGDYGIKMLSDGGIFVEVFLDECGGTKRLTYEDGSKVITQEHFEDMLWVMKNVNLKAPEFSSPEQLAPKETLERPFMPVVIEGDDATPSRNEKVEKVLAFMEKVPCSIAPYNNWKEFAMVNMKQIEIVQMEHAGTENYGKIQILGSYLESNSDMMVLAAILFVHEGAHRFADISKNYLYTHTPEDLKNKNMFVVVTPDVTLRTESFAVRATIQFLDDIKKNNQAHIDGVAPDMPNGTYYFGTSPVSNMLYGVFWQIDYLHDCRKAAEPTTTPIKK